MIFSVGVLLLPLVYSQPPGWLNSPEHPLAYPNSIEMNWTQCAPTGFAISLTLIHLDLESSSHCERDALIIYSGMILNKSLCGNMSYTELQSSVNPYLHSASGACLSVYFRSDDSLPQSHTGFNAFYQTRDVNECQSKPCSHFCNNFIGGYRCSCPHGYLLSHNNHTCDEINCGHPKPLRNGHVKFVKGSNYGYLSVIEFHCNEPFYIANGKTNGNYTCSAAQKWRETGNNIIPSCHYVCGKHKSRFGRIFGGQPATSGSFPWQVYLRVNGNRGGAIIIGEKWLMTAAHNLVFSDTNPTQKDKIEVYVGHNNLSEMTSFTILNISSVHVHANYTTNYDNDIALIELTSPITFSETIRPVCLPPKYPELKNINGLVSGYGLMETWFPANQLVYVDLVIGDQEKCRAFFKKSKGYPSVTDNMFCAAVIDGKDSCQGDSGSAFVVEENYIFYAKGIVSWGLTKCGQSNTYGVYTQVSRYIDWMNKKMSEN